MFYITSPVCCIAWLYISSFNSVSVKYLYMYTVHVHTCTCHVNHVMYIYKQMGLSASTQATSVCRFFLYQGIYQMNVTLVHVYTSTR